MTIGRQLHFLFHSALLSHFLFHSALLSACLYSPKQENVMIRNLVPSYSYMVLYYDLRLGWSFPRFDLICSVLLWMKIANNKQDEHGKKNTLRFDQSTVEVREFLKEVISLFYISELDKKSI